MAKESVKSDEEGRYENSKRVECPCSTTCDAEGGGGVTERDELVFASAVIDDNLHAVGAQRDVVSTDGEGGGRPICYLPVSS